MENVVLINSRTLCHIAHSLKVFMSEKVSDWVKPNVDSHVLLLDLMREKQF